MNKTRRCAVCGKQDCRAFLFIPSNIFVFLCDKHSTKRINDTSIPIKQWVEEQKKYYEDLKKSTKQIQK